MWWCRGSSRWRGDGWCWGVLTIDLSWAATLDGFAATRQVVAVELQGHGHTPDVDRPISIGVYADDVVALLDHLGVDQADLFGFSLGGLVAMEAAVRHPERIGRLVAAAVHFRPDGYHDEITDPALHEGSTRMPTAADFAEMRTAYEAIAPDADHFDAFTDRTGEQVVGAFQGWSPELLQAMSVPTLVMVGDHDFVRLDHAVAMLGFRERRRSVRAQRSRQRLGRRGPRGGRGGTRRSRWR